MSTEQHRIALAAREKVYELLKSAAYNHTPCPRIRQIAALINRGEKSAQNHLRELHKAGRIIVHQLAHHRMIVEVDGRKSKASILLVDEKNDNAIDDDYDIVVDEKKNFAAFLARFNLRRLRFEDSSAACKPERPWTKRPEPRTSSGVAQYG